jgi:hypothetical protein
MLNYSKILEGALDASRAEGVQLAKVCSYDHQEAFLSLVALQIASLQEPSFKYLLASPS